MSDVDRVRVLRGCGGVAQFIGGLCVLGGTLSMIIGVATGRWPEPLEHDLPPVLSASFAMLMVALGVATISLAQAMKGGNVLAGRVLVAIAWVVLTSSVVHLCVFGRGWYEAALFAFVVIDLHVALSCAKRGRVTKPEPKE